VRIIGCERARRRHIGKIGRRDHLIVTMGWP
jgi:hypothetical protein